MNKTLILVISILISMDITFAQNKDSITIRTIQESDLKSEYLIAVYKNFQRTFFLDLPIDFKRASSQKIDSIHESYRLKRIALRYTGYPYRDKNSPFVVNYDRRNKKRYDRDTQISYLFNKTTGEYMMGTMFAWSGDHIVAKMWLTTFDFSGNLIDYLPISNWYYSNPEMRIIESQINKDFTVNVQRLDFPDNDSIIIPNEGRNVQLIENLKGQRIDSKYQITTEGKFLKLEEIRYQPQIYTSAMLFNDSILIRKRGERELSRKSYTKDQKLKQK